MFCSYGFTATGGVRLRRADVSKSVNFTEARLGGEGPVALNLYGLTTQELVLWFAVPPIGDVWLTRAEVASVYDSGQLWRTDGVLDLEDFRYAAITADVEVDVRTRLRWLEGTVREYDPDPYDQARGQLPRRRARRPGRCRTAGQAASPARVAGAGWAAVGVAICSTECGSLFRFVSFRPAGQLADVTLVVGGSRVPGRGAVGGF